MVIRRFVVGMSADRIRLMIVGNVDHNKQVVAADGFFDKSFGFTGAETRSGSIDDISVTLKTPESDRCLVIRLMLMPPFDQVLVDFFAERGAV